jgi:hypothetical protein
MSGYAILSEVYPDWKKKKKSKKVKSRQLNVPLSPNEMDKELLNDDLDDKINLKLKNMNVGPYTDNDLEYQGIDKQDYMVNDNVVSYENQLEGPTRSKVDPEYEEFLEYKRMKQENKNQKKVEESKLQVPSVIKNMIDTNDQFNELLLYIFTGFFLLMIYDNIYKLGRDS